MPIAEILTNFRNDVAQSESLIINAHQTIVSGSPLLPEIDRQQITVAAFLNMFIAWETFLEDSLLEFMMGNPTLNGSLPARYIAPIDLAAAERLVLHVSWSYFDYSNHQNVATLAKMFFQSGYPFEPHLSGAFTELADSKTMRNWCAHKTSSTQTALEGVALRLFKKPQLGISLYTMLMSSVPQAGGPTTVFAVYRAKLETLATLIATG